VCSECGRKHTLARPRTHSMCEDCGLRRSTLGLPGDSKKCRWCSECGRKHTLARRTHGMCEDCGQKQSSWGVAGDSKRVRWCDECGKKHEGAHCVSTNAHCGSEYRGQKRALNCSSHELVEKRQHMHNACSKLGRVPPRSCGAMGLRHVTGSQPPARPSRGGHLAALMRLLAPKTGLELELLHPRTGGPSSVVTAHELHLALHTAPKYPLNAWVERQRRAAATYPREDPLARSLAATARPTEAIALPPLKPITATCVQTNKMLASSSSSGRGEAKFRSSAAGGESFLRVHWVAVPKATRARRANRRRICPEATRPELR
jgi:hypothetical protein